MQGDTVTQACSMLHENPAHPSAAPCVARHTALFTVEQGHTHTKTALAKAGRIKNDSGKMVFVEMREIFVKSDTVFVRCNAIYHHNLAIGSTTPVKSDQSGVALVKPFTTPKSIASRLLGLHVTAARN